MDDQRPAFRERINDMRIWLLGTEGRLAKMARHLNKFGHDVFFSGPGCPGTERHASRIKFDLKELDFQKMRQLASDHAIDLAVPGSEDLLDQGIVNEFEGVCRVFGPTREAVKLETDKRFSYEIMTNVKIPQAFTRWYENFHIAYGDLKSHFDNFDLPLVIKPQGPTAGKGVIVAHDLATGKKALKDMLVDHKYKEASRMIGLADYLTGSECTVFVLSDGHEDSIRFFAAARDCKAAWPAKDGKPAGPNTGGMWGLSSIPEWDEFLYEEVMGYARNVIRLMRRMRHPFRGCLYISLKLVPMEDLPRLVTPTVVEFNGRFGDPEAQATFERLESDLAPILWACTESGKLNSVEIKMSDRVGGCLVIAAPGYPESSQKGGKITGTEEAEALGVEVEHCGTKLNDANELVVDGGRVLNLNASDANVEALRDKLNRAAACIHFEGGQHWRNDFGDPSVAS